LVTGWDFSPDGRYWAIKELDGGMVLDLTTLRRLSLPGGLQALVNPRFAFVAGGEALGTDDPSQKNWKLVQFPSDKVVQKYHLGNANIVAETHGPFLIAQPLNRHPAGVVNPATGRVLFTSDTADLDGYGSLFAGETKGGAIVLVQYSPKALQNVAELNLPTAPLADLIDAGASTDLRLLAVSEPNRGAIWDLASSQPRAAMSGFSSHWFSGLRLWMMLNPTEQQREAARIANSFLAAGSEVEFDVGKGTRQELPALAKDHAAGLVGGEEVVMDLSSPPHARMEVHAADGGKLLWQRKFDASEWPKLNALMGGGAWVLANSLKWHAAKVGLEQDAAAEAWMQAHKKSDIGLWLELVDPQTGKSERQWLLDPAPSLKLVFRLGGGFYLTDADHRTLDYDWASGQLQRVWFGDALAASPAAKAFVLQTKPRTLKLYADGGAASRQTYRFPQDVVLAQFSGGGRRLLWLARAPARLRRASRLCSRRLGGPGPQVGAAPRRGRAECASRGRAALRNFAALRADFAGRQSGATPARC